MIVPNANYYPAKDFGLLPMLKFRVETWLEDFPDEFLLTEIGDYRLAELEVTTIAAIEAYVEENKGRKIFIHFSLPFKAIPSLGTDPREQAIAQYGGFCDFMTPIFERFLSKLNSKFDGLAEFLSIALLIDNTYDNDGHAPKFVECIREIFPKM